MGGLSGGAKKEATANKYPSVEKHKSAGVFLMLQDRRIILKAFKKLKGAHSRRLNIFGQACIFIFIIVAIFCMRHFEQWSDSIFVQWVRNSSMINLINIINIIKRPLN